MIFVSLKVQSQILWQKNLDLVRLFALNGKRGYKSRLLRKSLCLQSTLVSLPTISLAMMPPIVRVHLLAVN